MVGERRTPEAPQWHLGTDGDFKCLPRILEVARRASGLRAVCPGGRIGEEHAISSERGQGRKDIFRLTGLCRLQAAYYMLHAAAFTT